MNVISVVAPLSKKIIEVLAQNKFHVKVFEHAIEFARVQEKEGMLIDPTHIHCTYCTLQSVYSITLACVEKGWLSCIATTLNNLLDE